MKQSLLLIVALVPFFFLNCTKEQPKVSWLVIEKWDLLPNSQADNDQGELTHNFNQVFLNMDGKAMGAFELPCKVPIIGEGEHDFVLIPGVVKNGINDTKARYPFVENYVTTATLKLEDTIYMQPTTKYFATVKFLIEDFESPGMNFENEGSTPAELYRDDDPDILKWGNFFGRVDLNDEDSLFVGYTTFGESLPINADVYLELDYMNSNSVLTSVLSFGNETFFDDIHVQINPQDNPEWKKIYIDLREIITFRSSSPINEQSFTAVLDEEGTQKFIYFDNLKVVYR